MRSTGRLVGLSQPHFFVVACFPKLLPSHSYSHSHTSIHVNTLSAFPHPCLLFCSFLYCRVSMGKLGHDVLTFPPSKIYWRSVLSYFIGECKKSVSVCDNFMVGHTVGTPSTVGLEK